MSVETVSKCFACDCAYRAIKSELAETAQEKRGFVYVVALSDVATDGLERVVSGLCEHHRMVYEIACKAVTS